LLSRTIAYVWRWQAKPLGAAERQGIVARAGRTGTAVDRRSLGASNQEDSAPVAAGGDVDHQPRRAGRASVGTGPAESGNG